MRPAALTIAFVLVACGDNLEPPVVEVCAPVPPEVPPSGPLADPLALELPGDCITGGLEELPGRWFLVDPSQRFAFEYPRFEGNCTDGFRRAFYIDDDHDDSDGGSFYTWSDGTRIYYRDHVRFEFPGGVFEFATAFAACRVPGGKLAAIAATYDTDRGVTSYAMTGTRFEPRDTGARGLTLVGAVGAGTISGYNVAVDGGHAYVVGPTGLDVIDVSAPATPQVVGHVDGRFNDVKVVRTVDTVVAYTSPIRDERTGIVDVTVPTTPRFVGTIPEYSHSVFVVPGQAPRLYLATYTETIPVYDVTAPLVPVRLGGIPVAGSGETAGIHDIHVAGDQVWAMKTTDGVVALDVTPGLATPTVLGTHPTSYSHAGWEATVGGRRVFIHGDEGMTPEGGAFLRVLDADPASPTFLDELGRYSTRRDVGIHNMQIVGDRAYIAYYQDGVRVVDLSDPTMPREIAHYNTWDHATAPGTAFEGAIGVTVVDDLIYVADLAQGLVILRLAPSP